MWFGYCHQKANVKQSIALKKELDDYFLVGFSVFSSLQDFVTVY